MPRPKKRTVNKSAFVRSLPNVPASEVVAKAKQHGFVLSDKYVYNIRAKAKAQGGRSARRPGRPGRPRAEASKAGSAEQQFVELVLDLGMGRAEAVLTRLRAAVKSAIDG